MLRTYLVYNKVVQVCQFFCCGGKVLLRPEKKVIVVCLAGCAVVSGKNCSSRDFYAKLHVSNLNVMNLY